jgi:hypothetical protein
MQRQNGRKTRRMEKKSINQRKQTKGKTEDKSWGGPVMSVQVRLILYVFDNQ